MEIDIAIEIRVLLGELHHHALQLHILGLGHVGYKANDFERLLSTSVKAVDLSSDGSWSNSILCYWLS
jgi:hypothetical protein